jgi:hypothetical protein
MAWEQHFIGYIFGQVVYIKATVIVLVVAQIVWVLASIPSSDYQVCLLRVYCV